MSNPRTLLFVVNVDWFFVSHRLPIALKAIESGFEVHLLCAVTDKEQYLKSLGIRVHPFPFVRSGTNLFHETASFLKLYRKVIDLKPDLIHLVTIKPVLYGGIIARIARVPAVVSAISGLGFLFAKRSGVWAKSLRSLVLILYRISMGHPNQRVIFQNSSDMSQLTEAGGVDQARAVIIPGSGVRLEEFSMIPEPDGPPVVVMASRLLRNKGVVEFVEAARLLKSMGINAKFMLLGEPDVGNPESVGESEVRAWRDEGKVDCLGFCSNMSELFSLAHIVVLPSYYGEGLPKVLIEAAACGRAVVTTDMPGITSPSSSTNAAR